MAKLLDLNKLFDRNLVRVTRDGISTEYELRNGDELPPLHLHKLAAKYARVSALSQKAALTPDEEQEAERLPREICADVVLAPADVIATLDAVEQWQVCQAFFWQRNPTLVGMIASDSAARVAATTAALATSTGVN